MTDRLLLVFLNRMASGADHICDCPQATLAKMVGVSTRHLRSVIRKLTDLNYIKKVGKNIQCIDFRGEHYGK